MTMTSPLLDQHCPQCGAVNFGITQICLKCRADLPAPEADRALVICPQCGNKLSPDKRFCNLCGTQLAQQEVARPGSQAGEVDQALVACPQCGNKLPPDKRFCNLCGTQLVQQEVAKPGQEEHQVDEQDTDDDVTAYHQEDETISYLVVKDGDLAGQKFALKDGLEIGRSKTNDIVLSQVGVSRIHTRVNLADNGYWYITDLNSTNGTLLNGKQITEPGWLGDGGTLRIEDTTLIMVTETPAETVWRVEEEEEKPVDKNADINTPEADWYYHINGENIGPVFEPISS